MAVLYTTTLLIIIKFTVTENKCFKKIINATQIYKHFIQITKYFLTILTLPRKNLKLPRFFNL